MLLALASDVVFGKAFEAFMLSECTMKFYLIDPRVKNFPLYISFIVI